MKVQAMKKNQFFALESFYMLLVKNLQTMSKASKFII